MSLHWLNLLPLDRYTVQTSSMLNEIDRMIVTLLYQPLIGAVAHSLYFALHSELEKDQFISSETTHKTLMTMTGLSLDVIYEERKKLEGIGLLNVYKKKIDDDVTYLYELQKPFSPSEFFRDDVLSVYLYNRIGKQRYLKLRERFSLSKINKEEFVQTTLSFSDVFTSLHHSEIAAHQSELSSNLAIPSNQEVVTNSETGKYEIETESFDFSLLTAHLSKLIDPSKLLNEKVKQVIVRLAFIYRIDPYEMSKIIQDSLMQDDTVDLERMREKVKSWYRFSYESEPPALALRVQPHKFRTMEGKKPSNEEEEMILIYETESPLTLLENRSPGAKVPPADAKIIEALLLDFKLLPGVANVLIDFVLEINDLKLTKSFVEKIAAQWARKNIKTVKEAMAFAKEEFQKRNQWQQAKTEVAATKEKPRKTTNANQYVRKERLPKWLTDEKDKLAPVSNKQQVDIEKVKVGLEEKLKRLKSQRKEEGS